MCTRKRLPLIACISMLTLLLLADGFVGSAQVQLLGDTIPFTEHVVADGYEYPRDVFAIDLDDDGDMDILAPSYFAGTIAWWKNNGSESFAQESIGTGSSSAWSVYPADVDGDGDTDVLSAAGPPDELVWWENDGSESFTAHSIATSWNSTSSVYADDLDGDEDVDLLAASHSAATIAWWENDGSEGFTQHIIDSSFDFVVSVHAADVDGDGERDVLGAAEYGNEIAWWKNNPTGEPPPASPINWTKYSIAGDVGWPRDVYAIDLDDDGDTDVLSAAGIDNDVTWWENDGDENFSEHTIADDFGGASSVFALDVDGDGDVDVLGAARTTNEVAWWRNDGSENFTQAIISDNLDGAWAVHAADVDGDLDVDVLGSGYYAGVIAWWEQGEPVPNAPPELTWPGDANYGADGLHPESGEDGDNYVYRIKYTDPEGDAPDYVQVHIKKGGSGIIGSPFLMACESGDYVEGVICSYTKAGLEHGTDYTYFFAAQGLDGNPATPTQELDAPDVIVLYRVYLPVVLRNANIPDAPVLYMISNPGGVSEYDVSWSPVSGADSYTLQQDDNAGFSTPSTVYNGPDTAVPVSVGEVGTYFYRVQASNSMGHSPWSNVRSVVVTDVPVGPEPGHYIGSLSVSFDVTEGMQVCNFDIKVPFAIYTCRIRPGSCADVTDNEFGFSSSEVGAIYVITGTFDTTTHAVGNYTVSMCENILITPPSTGTWHASK